LLLTARGGSYGLLSRLAPPVWRVTRRRPRRRAAGLSARIQVTSGLVPRPWFGGLPGRPSSALTVAIGAWHQRGEWRCWLPWEPGHAAASSSRRRVLSMPEAESIAALCLNAPAQRRVRRQTVTMSSASVLNCCPPTVFRNSKPRSRGGNGRFPGRDKADRGVLEGAQSVLEFSSHNIVDAPSATDG